MQRYKIVYKGRKDPEEYLLPDDGLFRNVPEGHAGERGLEQAVRLQIAGWAVQDRCQGSGDHDHVRVAGAAAKVTGGEGGQEVRMGNRLYQE